MDQITQVFVNDIDPAVLVGWTEGKIASVSDAAELVAQSDLVIEAANQSVVESHILPALEAGKRCMILTVGALADEGLHNQLVAACTRSGAKLHVPTGAVMGIDGVRSANAGKLRSATLVTTKPSAGLEQDVDKWTLLYNGNAREAVRKFPKNVNVAATLALAGLGFEETWVQVAVDPLASRNSHKLILEGDFGRARIEVENLPSPDNPRTSRLATLSAIACLQRILSPIEVGC